MAPPSELPPCAFIPWAGPLGIARGSAQSGLVLSRQIKGLGRLLAAGEYGSPLIWGHVGYLLSARPTLGSGDPAANKIEGTNHLFICPLKNLRSGQNGHPFIDEETGSEDGPIADKWTSGAHVHFGCP